MKWLHLITVFIFGSFIYVNANDHDFLKWTLIYLPMVIIAILAIAKKINSNIILLYAAALIFYLVANLEDYAKWSANGAPSMLDLESANVEVVREFFGVLITLLTALAYWFGIRRKSKTL